MLHNSGEITPRECGCIFVSCLTIESGIIIGRRAANPPHELLIADRDQQRRSVTDRHEGQIIGCGVAA
jgi:hypothetical protein